MDWNTLLLWLAGPSCLIMLVASLRASPRLKGWIFVCLAIPAIGATAFVFLPQNVGFITAGLWMVFVAGPALLQKSTIRWSVRQQYDRAAKYASVAGVLHPFDGMPQQTKYLRAMALAERGEITHAVSILHQLEQTAPIRIARAAAVHLRRLENDWAGLVDWVRSNIDQSKLAREYNILPMYVRALGEIGNLPEMLRVASSARLSSHPQMAPFRNMCQMFVFAFSGQPQQVEEILTGVLGNLPENVRRYWIATATYAAGLVPHATAELDALESVARPELRLAIQRRRANPPALASSILTPADLALLDQLDRQQEHDRRFAHTTPGRRRPWVTYTFILANLIAFGFEWAMGASAGNWMDGGTMSEFVLDRLGAMEPNVLYTHEYYRLLTANFLHYGYAHVLMNMLALWILGPFVEFSLGQIVYALFYLASGICVMATVLLFQVHNWMEPEMLLGASGAIMAIIGATAAILLRGLYREQATAALRRLGVVGLMLVMQVTFDHFTPQVSGAAHIAGMVWGFVIAGVLPHGRRSRRNSNDEIRMTNQ